MSSSPSSSAQKTGGGRRGGAAAPSVSSRASAGSIPGPIKATQAFGLTTTPSHTPLEGGGGQGHSTRTKRSDRQQSGSPGRGDRRTLSDGVRVIQKSRSVDSVAFSCYLNGEWPRADPLVAQAYFCPSNLTSDRATQTPQEWCHLHSTKSLKSEASGQPALIASADSLKTIRACLTRSSRESRRHTLGGSCQSNSVLTFHHRFSPLGLALPSKPVALSELQRTRGRVFGSPDSLSQEIEKLSMAANISYSVKSSPDGRCAPVAAQLKTCSAETQTPSQFSQSKEISSSVESLLLVPASDFPCRTDMDCKESNSPELVRFASPHLLTDRLAPEGCEKICGKFQEVKKADELTTEVPPSLKVPSSTCHIPSDSSAFNPPLVKNYTSLPTLKTKKTSSV